MFLNEIDSLYFLCVPSFPFFAYYRGAFFGNDDRSTQSFQRMVALEFVVLTLSAFLSTFFHGATMLYYGEHIQHG